MSVGIDFGTTYSYVYTIADDESSRKEEVPSYIWFPEDFDAEIIGKEAKDQRDRNSEDKNIVYGLKHLIGFGYNQIDINGLRLTFEIEDSADGPRIKIRQNGQDKLLEPKYLTTIFLKQLKEIATGLLRPQVIQSVVVAIPVSFRTEQCDMMKAILREVFAEANVIVDTITEHSAAAIAYKFTKEVSNEQEKILLVDLGGGMLDISCITLIWTDDKKPDALKVGQTESDPRVGGRYFTDRLVEHFEGQLDSSIRLTMTDDQKARLRKACDDAKKALSNITDDSDYIVDLDRDLFPDDELRRLDVAKFNQICSALFGEIEELLKKFKNRENIDKILLVGGASRMKGVAERVSTVFGKDPELYQGDFEYAIASGAAQYAKRKAAGPEGVDSIDVDESVPFSLGIETRGGLMKRIIERHAKTPVKKTDKFTTTFDNQESVAIRVYEGERALAKHNFPIGEFTLDGIPRALRGVPQIEVTFDAENGSYLEVYALNQGRRRGKHFLPRKPLSQESATTDANPELDDVAKAAITEMKGLDSYIYTLRRKNVNNSRIKTEVDKTSAWLTGEINSPPEQRSLDNFKQLQKACKEQGTALRRNVERILYE